MDNATITNLAVTNMNLDNVTVGSNLVVSGTAQLNDVVTINNNLIIQDNASVRNNLDVTGTTNLVGTLGVSGLATMDNTSITTLNVTGTSNLLNTNIGGTLSVTGLTTLDNTSITTLNVTGLSNLSSLNVTGDTQLSGNLALGGDLTVSGNATFDNATVGILATDTSVSSSTGDYIMRYNNGEITFGQNSIRMQDDLIYSTNGRMTIGDSDNHVTKVRGILSIQDPTEPDHAATRRYVDQSAAMAAALDTRNPEKGKNFHMQLGGATKNQENALGLNFAGSMFLVNAPGASDALPFSISAGISNSSNQYMGKLSVGLSW
jgi:hypothetical protein